MGGGGRDQCNLFKQAYLQWFWLWGYKVAINDIIYKQLFLVLRCSKVKSMIVRIYQSRLNVNVTVRSLTILICVCRNPAWLGNLVLPK